jgi:hypothetical protein
VKTLLFLLRDKPPEVMGSVWCLQPTDCMRLMQAELELVNMVNAIESVCTGFTFTGLLEHTASNGNSHTAVH